MAYKEKILSVRWLGNARPAFSGDGTIGIVAAETFKDEWQAFLGITENTWTEEFAIQQIVGYGIKLSEAEAHAFFPQLAIEKYKKQI